MNVIKSYRVKGSALLTILLVMAALGSLLLFIFRDNSSATRQLNLSSDSSRAAAVAQSGLEEGLLRYQKASSAYGVYDGEYGVEASKNANPAEAAASYALNPWIRGYTDDACTTLSTLLKNASGLNKNCPEYSLSIRKKVRIGKDSSSVNSSRFTLEPDLLLQDKEVVLAIPKKAENFTFKLDVKNDKAAVQVLYTGPNSSKGLKVLTKASDSFVISNATEVRVKAASRLDGRGLIINTSQPILAPFVMSKGSTTIVSTGTYNGRSVTKMVTIPDADTSKRIISESGVTFDSAGLPQ